MTNDLLDSLILQLQGKNRRDALEKIYLLLRKDVYGVAYALTYDSHAAEDVTEETFLRLLTACHRYHPKGRGKSFVLQVARNAAKEFLRQKKRQIPTEELPEIPCSDPSAEEKLTALSLVERLPEKEREVVFLHYYSGLTMEEIGEITKTPTGTVKYRQASALKKMRAWAAQTPATKDGGKNL